MENTDAGNFIWYDLLTSDPGAAVAFYEHVFDWTSSMGGSPDYAMFSTAQGMLGGAGKLPEPMKKQGVPAHWQGAVKVADVDAKAALATKLGGRVYLPPTDYPNAGRLAVVADPFGAAIKLFAPLQNKAAHDGNQPGEFVWHELLSQEHEVAFTFYSQLFGWKKVRDFDLGAMGKYVIFGNGGPDLGGMFTKPKEVPMSAWVYYVHVLDLDATLARAQAKGARVIAGPMDVPGGGRIVQLTDPQGAMFALHEKNTP